VSRLNFLAETIRSLAEFPVASLDVVVVTNAVQDDELRLLQRLCDEALAGQGVVVKSHDVSANPWDLTWRHKQIIKDEFVPPRENGHTHFVYLEGDIRLSFINFCYFVEFREKLRGHGMLPAFVRTEFYNNAIGFTASDAFWPVYAPLQPNIVVDDFLMTNMPNPYNPLFILDAELAAEYVRSQSFDANTSRQVCRWGVPERSAMGLCLEDVPAPFYSRYLVPVSRLSDKVPAFACVSHLPNNYANNLGSPLGKVRLDKLFAGASHVGRDRRWFSKAPETFSSESASPERESADASAERHYLISDHDTLLYAQTNPDGLRNAPFGIAPLNLVLEREGQRGRLLLKDDVNGSFAYRQISLGPNPDEILVQAGRGDLDCDIETFADERIGVRFHNQRYLAADLDGMARINRKRDPMAAFRDVIGVG
jgi:hypothetical protein